MSRVITFSRVFPSYHPKAGQPTYFVEKFWNSICWDSGVPDQQFPIPYHIGIDFRSTDQKKHHTIRSGHRWKVGDWFSPRVWSGKPYNSKMIQFAPDIQVKKVWDINMMLDEDHKLTCNFDFDVLAKNDGLSMDDLEAWFKLPYGKEFHGQIICWNESIEY